MPKYTVICRGSLTISKGVSVPTGGEVEMSEAHAASLPLDTVKLIASAKPVESKKDK